MIAYPHAQKETICNSSNIQAGLCTPQQEGQFLISAHARQRARHPFLTRAVNLTAAAAATSSLVLHYPVHASGLYCVAAVPYASPPDGLLRFQAAMIASDPGSGRLSSFRAGLLRAYRWLGPAWLALFTGVALLLGGNRPRLLRQLPVLAAAQTAARWAALEAGEAGVAARGFRVVWYVLAAAQDWLVLRETCRVAGLDGPPSPDVAGRRSWERRWLACGTAAAVFVVPFSAAAAWADWTATASSRLPACVNVVSGSVLAGFVAVCAAWFAGRSKRISSAGVVSRLFCFFLLGCLAAIFASVAAVNGAALVRYGTSQEYAQKLWTVRFWLVDGANEFLFLVWAATLPVLDLCSAKC